MYLALSFFSYMVGFGLLANVLHAPAQAQAVPKSLEEGGSDAALRYRKNNGTVGVAGGQLSGTYMTFANELAEVLDRALSADPELRPNSAAEFLQAVNRAAEGAREPVTDWARAAARWLRGSPLD
jgi:hypothetical protein